MAAGFYLTSLHTLQYYLVWLQHISLITIYLEGATKSFHIYILMNTYFCTFYDGRSTNRTYIYFPQTVHY
jgi:hypothetical protein